MAGELRAEFEHGAYLVELAPLADPGLVAEQAATALGIELRSERAPADVVVADEEVDGP